MITSVVGRGYLVKQESSNVFSQTWQWITDGTHWTGNEGIWWRTAEHLGYTALTFIIAAAIALPLGFYLGHKRKGEAFVTTLSGGLRALPTLGLLTLFVLLMGLGLFPPILALVILAIAPLLISSHSAIISVTSSIVDGARAQGMTDFQIFYKAELPNSLHVLLGGIRSAILQIIATATIVAYINLGGLGRFIIDGLALNDYPEMLSGAVMVAALAVIVDFLLSQTEKILTSTQ